MTLLNIMLRSSQPEAETGCAAQEEFLQMINEPVEGGLGEGAADLLARMGGAFGGEEGGEEGGGAPQGSGLYVAHMSFGTDSRLL